MKLMTIFLLLLVVSGGGQAQIPEVLPDDYLVFDLKRAGDRLIGGAEHFPGFILALDLPAPLHSVPLDRETLLSFIEKEPMRGELTYPGGKKKTPILCEVVRHRGRDDVYMKTSLGHFLWETTDITTDRIAFAIYWWYRPPATKGDLRVLALARRLLATPGRWERRDDRKCDEDLASGRYSLFCALKQASMDIMKEYNHHNAAVQTVREVIGEMFPGREFEHTLMDFNNDPGVTHDRILGVLAAAESRIAKEIHR